MAIMDITDIEPLLMAVYELLQESGIFVFATQHPCFVTLTEKYMTPHSYYDIAIEGQPHYKTHTRYFSICVEKRNKQMLCYETFCPFFNDTSYTHHKTIFNQCIIFSRQMFFQTVFIILGDLNY